MKDRKIKILWFCGSHDGTPQDGAELTCQLVTRLAKHKIDSVLVTYFKEQKILLSKKGLHCVYLPGEKEKFKVNDINQELRELELRYDFCAERVLMGDPDYSDSVSRKKAFIDLIKYFRIWEEVLEKEKPDVIFGGDNRFGNLVPYYVSKKKKIRYEIIYFSPIVPNSFVITEDKDGRLTEMEKYWEQNKHKKLTSEEKSKVEEYVNKFRVNQDKPPMIDTKPKLNLEKIKYALERIYAAWFIEKNDTPYLNPARGIKSYLWRMIRNYGSRIYFEEIPKDENFIFFPLQVHLETTLLISNHQFFHQDRLIDLISKNLPMGYKLYVKGHPGYLGGHELSLYRAIKKLPNVRIINPLVNARDLIKRSKAVAVSIGTSGWEALILKKPVITFGINYYDYSGLTFKVEDLSITDRIISQAVSSHFFDDEKLFRFINSYIKTVYPGRIGFTGVFHANESNRKFVLGEENLQAAVNSLVYHLRKWDQK